MHLSVLFIRGLFFVIAVLFSINFASHYFIGSFNLTSITLGILSGSLLTAILISIDLLSKRFNLKAFNIALLGIFVGYLMGLGFLLTLEGILGVSTSLEKFIPLRFLVFLFSTYLGMILTARAAQEIHLNIPFMQLQPLFPKQKRMLIDSGLLQDARIIDLAMTGILDSQLLITRFTVKELSMQAESSEESLKAKARKSLETLKKLESLPHLDLKYIDNDIPTVKDSFSKLLKVARFLETSILSSDASRLQQSPIEGVRIIDLNTIYYALKPGTQRGETIKIKVLRHGREPKQGIGYLEDGTMVVVNGGADFLDKTITAHVISDIQTSSGKMIFCNATVEEFSHYATEPLHYTSQDLQPSKAEGG